MRGAVLDGGGRGAFSEEVSKIRTCLIRLLVAYYTPSPSS